MTDLATLTDTVTANSITFAMSPDWEPSVPEIGAIYYPLGYPYAVKLTDGTKGIQGTMTIVSDSADMEATVLELLQSTNILELVLPDGSTYYVVWNPGTARKGKKQFSLINTPTPINVWTVDYVEVASP